MRRPFCRLDILSSVLMAPELIVVNGPQAGMRHRLDRDEFVIGRAPNAALVLAEPEVAWRHCQVRKQSFKYLVTDLRTSSGTYVNGMRTAERWLEDRDQIGIGKTILMFRSTEGMETDRVVQPPRVDTKPVCWPPVRLCSCSGRSPAEWEKKQNSLLQNQILRLIRDRVPARDGLLLVGAGADELRVRFRSRVPRRNRGSNRRCSRSAKKARLKMPQPDALAFRCMWVGC